MKISRRGFLKRAAIAGAGLLIGSRRSAWARPVGVNDTVRVAVIGMNSKGADHIQHLLKIPNARITALCDVDPNILNREVQKFKDNRIDVFACTDARKLLECDDIDAVVIATPNHWHALLTIWACRAGKDVYVEKPIAHNIWEGRKMIEAANKYGRIVQCGTQTRSCASVPQVLEYIRAGHLGKIRYIHALWFKLRRSIGRVNPWYPDWLNYDIFCGRAPMAPLERKNLHHDWHWNWETGNGDLCNLGLHQFDLARLYAGHNGPPPRILSLGGRFAFDDVGQTPNTQLTVFDYPEIPIIVETRGLPAKTGVDYMDHLRGIREGVIVQCEGGYYAGYRGGWIYDNDGKKIKQIVGDGGVNHMKNFLDAVKSRSIQKVAAPVQVGHISNSCCLFGNISYRLGLPTDVGKIRKTLQGYPLATEALNGIEKHLAENGVNPKQISLNLGPWLTIDRGGDTIQALEGVLGSTNALQRAKDLLKDSYRPPYIIPDEV